MIVADAGPILSFARAERLGLLRAVLPSLILPQEVHGEIVEQGAGRPGAAEVAEGVGSWLEVRTLGDAEVLDRVGAHLGAGEREALALGLELGLPVLVDERAGRREAQRLGLERVSSLIVLRRAVQTGLIPRARPVLDELIEAGFRLGRPLYEAFLQDLGELDGEEEPEATGS